MRSLEEPDGGIWEVRNDPPTHPSEDDVRGCRHRDVDLPKPDYPTPTSSAGGGNAQCVSCRTKCYSREGDTATADHDAITPATDGRLAAYDRVDSSRLMGTVDAVRREIAPGLSSNATSGGWPPVRTAPRGLLVVVAEALARPGRIEEATDVRTMSWARKTVWPTRRIVPRALPSRHFPQGLSHLALVNAAIAIAEATR